MSRFAIHIAFFLSGFAGLVYQIVWVRFFGNALGNTLPSASIITGIFMLGLGVGSWVAGRWIDENEDRISPAKAYAVAEGLIAVIGLALAALLPNLDVLAGAITVYTEGANGWQEVSTLSHVALGLVAVITLLPATLLMGATLSLLIRHVLRDNVDDAGWQVAALYGANTGGAALGAFATDAALVPVFGLFATAGLAALANLIAALVANRLDAQEASPPLEHVAGPEGEGMPRGVLFVALAVFLSGFAAMGLEIAWFRFFNITMGSYRAVFSLLLATMLASMWVGSLVAGWLERRTNRPRLLFMVAQAGVVASTLGLLVAHDPQVIQLQFAEHILDSYRASGEFSRDILMSVWQLRSIAAVIAIPAALMGFAFPLANAIIQDTTQKVGARAGALYFANTSGNVAGASLTGLLLIPWLGTSNSVTILASIGILAIPCIWASGARRPVPLVLTVAIGLISVGAWASTDDVVLEHANPYPASEATLLTVSEGPYEVIGVTEHHHNNTRRLMTNGFSMSATVFAAERYMRLFAHFPLLHIEDPKRALIICFGVGNTAHATSLHPLERIDIADLSRNVLEHAHYFERWNHGVLDDPRVNVFVQDGRNHLRATEENTYDLVTLEPPPPAHANVSSLYTKEFYELARSRLRKGGFVTQWLPVRQFPPVATLAMIRAFQDVFPDAIMLSGSQMELILVGRHDAPIETTLADLSAMVEQRPAVANDLEHIRARTPLDLLGTFAAGPRTLAAATENVGALTDDRPFLEYVARSKFVDFTVPESIFNPLEIGVWCTDCVNERGDELVPHEQIPALVDYLRVMDGVLRSEGLRRYNTLVPQNTLKGAVAFPPGITPHHPVVMENPYLRFTFHGDDAGL